MMQMAVATLSVACLSIALAARSAAEERDADQSISSAPSVIAQVFDLTYLPPIDSIGPQSNIAAFIQPSVPTELHVAALRRAWTVDPAIRDYRGVQENNWDFEAGVVPGFGDIGPEVDVKSMIAGLFSEPTVSAARVSSRRDTIFASIRSFFVSLASASNRDPR